jgi:hypothetical protein
MGEDITPSANAPAANADPALAATPSNAPAATDNNSDQPVSFEEARRLRSEGQALRKRLKAYEEAEEAAKTAALSDVEKANKRATDAEAQTKQYREQYISVKIELAAQKKGIIDPEMAALAVQKSLEYGEDGLPSNL